MGPAAGIDGPARESGSNRRVWVSKISVDFGFSVGKNRLSRKFWEIMGYLWVVHDLSLCGACVNTLVYMLCLFPGFLMDARLQIGRS